MLNINQHIYAIVFFQLHKVSKKFALFMLLLLEQRAGAMMDQALRELAELKSQGVSLEEREAKLAETEAGLQTMISQSNGMSVQKEVARLLPLPCIELNRKRLEYLRHCCEATEVTACFRSNIA